MTSVVKAEVHRLGPQRSHTPQSPHARSPGTLSAALWGEVRAGPRYDKVAKLKARLEEGEAGSTVPRSQGNDKMELILFYRAREVVEVLERQEGADTVRTLG